MQTTPARLTGRMGDRHSFGTPFSWFGDTVYCPHCGQTYTASELQVVGDAGHGLKAALCPECGAHGAIPSDALSERGHA